MESLSFQPLGNPATMSETPRMLAAAGKFIPAVVLGSVGLLIGGKILSNSYETLFETDADRARKIRERSRKPNVFLEISRDRCV